CLRVVDDADTLAPDGRQFVDDVGPVSYQCSTIANEPIRAAARVRGRAAGDREDEAAEVTRQTGGGERSARFRRLDHERPEPGPPRRAPAARRPRDRTAWRAASPRSPLTARPRGAPSPARRARAHWAHSAAGPGRRRCPDTPSYRASTRRPHTATLVQSDLACQESGRIHSRDQRERRKDAPRARISERALRAASESG